MRIRDTIMLSLAAAALALVAVAEAATPQDLLTSYEAEARKSGAAFAGFSAPRGEALYRQERRLADGTTASCTSCHTGNPKHVGRARTTGKEIAPLAPTANAARLTDPAKTERWFLRNCNDVLGRACTPQEKGDFVRFLMNLV